MGNEELVADMVYNFVFPYVDKEIEKEKLRQNEQVYLYSAHKALSDDLFNFNDEESFKIYKNTDSVSILP